MSEAAVEKNTEELITQDEFTELLQSEQPESEKITVRQQVTPQMLATRSIRKMFGIRLQPVVRDFPKIGRNSQCICGSGKKFKKCCGAI